MNNPRVEGILGHLTISQLWTVLGGDLPKRARAKAFWRPKADGLNISLSDEKGVWFDHAKGEGGGLLDLVEHIKGCSRAEALRWLADLAGVPLEDRPLTATEKRDYARAKCEARPLAQAALWWWQARLSELEDLKREAVRPDGMDVEALAQAAQEAYRLQDLSAAEVVQVYMLMKRTDPLGTGQLVHIGEIWERACRAVIRAIIAKIEREQREAQRVAT
jgi:hypothetical protein